MLSRTLLSALLLGGSAIAVGTLDSKRTASALSQGSPILGFYSPCPTNSSLCAWQSHYPDSTPLSSMNLPGVHDAATWNYSQVNQLMYLNYTGPIPPASFYRCQSKSLFDALNDGIRVFDLRYRYGPDGKSLTFYHGAAMLAPHATLQDVVYGYYYWLTQNPTEALFLSLMNEGGVIDQGQQEQIYDMINTETAKQFWVQSDSNLGTLGEARGKITLLARFDFDLLPLSKSSRIGLNFSPSNWTRNGKNFTIEYNTPNNSLAYIEDFYDLTSAPPGVTNKIQAKFDVTTYHIDLAKKHPDQLFISFASATQVIDVPPNTPEVIAIGCNAAGLGIIPGVNQKLLPWFQERKGQQFGVVMLDFYDHVEGLVEAIIGM